MPTDEYKKESDQTEGTSDEGEVLSEDRTPQLNNYPLQLRNLSPPPKNITGLCWPT